MGNAKKILVFLMVISMLAASFVCASAEGTLSEDAQICVDIGMLRNDGSEVTAEYTATKPTRLMAAVMLLRLKGLEDEALAFESNDNFPDASGLAANDQKVLAFLKADPSLGFVGYLNGNFGPNDPITAKQYYKVLLTVLGYTVGTDYEWPGVFDFAATVGLTALTAETDFTVDSLAVATVEALKTALNGSTDTLAGSLVTLGALDANKVAEVGLPTTTGPVPIAVDRTAAYMSVGENFGWQNYIYTLGENNGGKQYASFDVTPLLDKVDASVDFADSQTDVGGFSDLAMLVRFNSNGFIDVRNAGSFACLKEVPFTANSKYHVEVFADMVNKTYTVYVTPTDGERTMIAENYAFRPSAADADDMGKVFFISASANDQMKVENFVRQNLLDSSASYLSKGENFGWQQNGLYAGKGYTGKLQIDYDMTTFIDTDDFNGSIDFADKDTDVLGFADLAMLVRMNNTGFWDVRNGGSFQKLVDLPYKANVKYHIQIIADMTAKTYTVYITPADGTKTMIAENYAFRTTANTADDIGQIFVISCHASDQIKAENITIKTIE